jgi:predicted lipid-binding transport protein (Tim44 family)
MATYVRTTAVAFAVAVMAPGAASAATTTPAQSGWGWWDAVIWGGALVGLVVLGFCGDVLIGGLIFGVVALVESAAVLATRTARGAARAAMQLIKPLPRSKARASTPL